LADGGANTLSPPKAINNVRLFAKQFLYKFWLLLMGLSFPCFYLFFIVFIFI
jgi:hypothetical protein